MKAHPIAELFPMLSTADAESLAESMRSNGFDADHPIVTLDGMILDGRNRFAASQVAGVAPVFKAFTGTDPLAYVVLANLTRRHLSESQRGMVAARIANLKNGRPKTSPIGEVSVSRTKAAEMLNVGGSTFDRARRVLKLAEPELVAAVDAGKVSLNAAAHVANLLPEKQLAVVNAEHPQKAANEAVKLLKTYDVKTEKEGVKTVRTLSSDVPKEARDHFRDGKIKEVANRAYELLSAGGSIVDVARELGVDTHTVQEVKRRTGLIKREHNPLAKISEFADEIASHFSMCATNFKPSWSEASEEDRLETIRQLELAVKATRQFINRLNKEAKQKEAS